jgi:6-pyruvoyltetrahydropterin/6-carboxytetrahydropterin synthase
MSRGVSVRHNFETAHRLPHLGQSSKCFNLHGHSWNCEVMITSDSVGEDGLVVEFGALKKLLREWIDHYWDHGAMLGASDPLLSILRAEGCKAYQFDEWPTVEAVAEELAGVAGRILATVPRAPDARVLRVVVQETAVNAAMWGEW